MRERNKLNDVDGESSTKKRKRGPPKKPKDNEEEEEEEDPPTKKANKGKGKAKAKSVAIVNDSNEGPSSSPKLRPGRLTPGPNYGAPQSRVTALQGTQWGGGAGSSSLGQLPRFSTSSTPSDDGSIASSRPELQASSTEGPPLPSWGAGPSSSTSPLFPPLPDISRASSETDSLASSSASRRHLDATTARGPIVSGLVAHVVPSAVQPTVGPISPIGSPTVGPIYPIGSPSLDPKVLSQDDNWAVGPNGL